MFSLVSVILSIEVCLVPSNFWGGWVYQGWVYPREMGFVHQRRWGRGIPGIPPWRYNPQYCNLVVATKVGGTHPIGMLSCEMIFLPRFKHYWFHVELRDVIRIFIRLNRWKRTASSARGVFINLYWVFICLSLRTSNRIFGHLEIVQFLSFLCLCHVVTRA